MKLPKILGVIAIILVPISLYALELHNLEQVLEIVPPDTSMPAGFGIYLASGDVNGDGFSDIIVGGGVLNDDLCVCVYYGSSTPDSIPDVILTNNVKPFFGRMVGCGNFNGDNYDDIVVADGGYTFVYFGGNPMDTTADLTIVAGEQTTPECGDLNNDGYDDIVVSYSFYNWLNIYLGGPNINTTPNIILRGDHLGDRLSSGYDVNNDGYDDLFVSALRLSSPSEVYIYYGGNPMDTIPDVTMSNPVYPGSFYGMALALLPDLNGDGYDDACVGMGMDSPHDTVFTYWGGNLMDNENDLVFSGDSGTRHGYAVSGVKKIHSGGANALIVGACYYPGGCYNSNGKIYVYLAGNFIDTVIDAYAVGEDSLQQIGSEVANAGDINGDGREEIMFSNYFSTYATHKVWVCKYTGPGVEENSNIKNQILKLEISRNPFVKSTTLKYQVPMETPLSLSIYDASGTLIKTLVNEQKQPGNYSVTFNAKGLSTGIYFAKFKAGSYQTTKKLIFIK